MAKSFDELASRTMSKESLRRAEAKANTILRGIMLDELRKAAGLTQKAVAQRLGIKQPSLSKLEHQRDMQIATLRKIVHALGGELDIIARLPNQTVRLRQFGQAG